MVEDNVELCGLIAETLSGKGYSVTAASRPDEALDLFDREPSFDLLLSDVVMPGMRGPELVARLLKQRPDLKVLLISGYDDGPTPGYPLLDKPFRPADLLREVARLLDKD